MRKFLSVALIFSAFLSACKDNPDIMLEREKRLLEQYLEQNQINATPLPSGLYFLEIQEGTGETSAPEDYVILEFTGSLIDGKVFDTTDEMVAAEKNIFNPDRLYGNSKLQIKQLNLKGFKQGIQLMKEGGEARLIMPSYLGYGSEPFSNIPAYSSLIYDVKLVKIIKDPLAHEALEIQNYIALYQDSTHLTIQSHIYTVADLSFEWYYIEMAEGTGDPIIDEMTVMIYYEGRLLDGRKFDSNYDKLPLRFTIGEKKVILGMELGIKKMKKDGKARIIMPSALAYGEPGSPRIPPFSPLVFDVEVNMIVE